MERALAGANPFGCKVPEVVEIRLDSIDKALAEIKAACTTPGHRLFPPNPSTASKTPSHALATSRHAPKSNATKVPNLTEFRPVLHKKPPPLPPTLLKSSNTVTLTQSVKEGTELLSLNYPSLIALVNTKLTEANIKENTTDQKPIQVRSAH